MHKINVVSSQAVLEMSSFSMDTWSKVKVLHSESATVKELLKSDSMCESYAQMKKGPVFLMRSVVYKFGHLTKWRGK